MLSKFFLLPLALGLWPEIVSAAKAAPDYDDYCLVTILKTYQMFTFNATTKAVASTTANIVEDVDGTSTTSTEVTRPLSRRATASALPATMCTNKDEILGIYSSVQKYCSEVEITKGIPFWRKQCKAAKSELMNLDEVKAEVTDEYIASLPWIQPKINSTKKALTKPAIIQEEYYRLAYHSYYSNDHARDIHNYYSWGIMGYWAGILVLAMIHKAWTVTLETLESRKLHKDLEGGSSRSTSLFNTSRFGAVGHAWHKLRTWIIIPAGLAPFFNKHQRLVAGWGIMPRRLDMLIVIGYWIVVIVLCCVGYDTFEGNIKFPVLEMNNLDFIGNRTGYMAEMGLVFIWVFSGRNNIFLWVTNFSFRSFNIFHRQSAIVATTMIVVHTATFVQFEAKYKKQMHELIHETFIVMGVMAGLSMFLLCLTAHPWVRRKSYELFLIAHIAMAVLVIYGVWYHVEKPDLQKRIFPLVAIWALERTLRILRLVYCNLHVRFGKHIVRNETTVEYVAESDLLRIEMTPGAAGSRFPFRTGPGQYYYLYQPASLLGWESHPFTLGSFATDAEHNGERIVFYVRPYDGWTKRLQNKCEKAKAAGINNGVIQPRMLLEGPYGHAAALHHFDTVLLFVGGTGISAALPYMQDYLRRKSENKTRTTKVHLIWSNRTRDMFDHVLTKDLSEALERPDVQLSCHLTQSKLGQLHRTTTLEEEEEDDQDKAIAAQRRAGLLSTSEAEHEKKAAETEKGAASSSGASSTDLQGSSSDEKKAAGGLDEETTGPSRLYTMVSGRPDVEAVTAEAVAEAREANTSVAVLVCGPGHMADKARKAVFTAMRSGFHEIEYFEEAFGW
ncbi:ferric reductase transmembrane component 4 precursor [Ophiostoma piceae UAMH 11346]|uniref:Ferric reductase transmembrane component 4 n=1 Tax=Ophiostoma piceae (strain UAMH 11346) TaxID=1262450 RepID=S3D193_OPHP1|nr:ferric reductase transmembrane component 4 precursor [Ophiostoma piceae UAMH 11346]